MAAFSLTDMNNFRDDVMSQPALFPLFLGREFERRQFWDLWKLKNNNNNNNNNKITKIVAKLIFFDFFYSWDNKIYFVDRKVFG